MGAVVEGTLCAFLTNDRAERSKVPWLPHENLNINCVPLLRSNLFFPFDKRILPSYRQLKDGERTVSRCSQDAERRACQPMLASDRDSQIRIAPSMASLVTS